MRLGQVRFITLEPIANIPDLSDLQDPGWAKRKKPHKQTAA